MYACMNTSTFVARQKFRSRLTSERMKKTSEREKMKGIEE